MLFLLLLLFIINITYYYYYYILGWHSQCAHTRNKTMTLTCRDAHRRRRRGPPSVLIKGQEKKNK